MMKASARLVLSARGPGSSTSSRCLTCCRKHILSLSQQPRRLLSTADPDTGSVEKEVGVTTTFVSSPKDREKVADVRRPDDALASVSKHYPLEAPLPGLPPLKAAGDMEVPKTLVTTLGNGLRVASQETYGMMTTFGMFVDVGSSYEDGTCMGVSHLCEAMAFKSTRTRTNMDVVNEIEDLGGMVVANSNREQMMYMVDVLRHSVPGAMDVLADALLNPTLDPSEVEEQKLVMQMQMEDLSPDMLVKERLQIAAFNGEPIGLPHLAPLETLGNLSVPMLQGYMDKHYRPERMVLAAAGVDHGELVALAEQHFGGVVSRGDRVDPPAKSVYQGGEARVDAPPQEGLTHVAVAWRAAGWHDDDLVPTCVLQMLLGGGSSFSAGGPGKGMYSRLYRDVLNQHYWVEAAEAFTSMHADVGLIGISGACSPQYSVNLVHILCEQFHKLSTQKVAPIDLARARNMLKSNVLMQLESRAVLFEDIGRQLLTYGRRETPAEIVARIDAVTEEDIQRVAGLALMHPPSVASCGDLASMPTYETVLSWFGRDATGKVQG